MKKRNSLFLIIIFIFTLTISPIFAISQPQNINPLFKKEIYSVAGASITGEPCSNQYKITGSYCSGNLRIYYQCLPSSSGWIWQKRVENCGDYNYICYAGDCVPSSTSNILKQNFLLITTIIILSIIIYYLGVKSRR